MKKILLILLILLFLLGTVFFVLATPREADISLSVNGTPISLSSTPYTVFGEFMVSADDLADALDADFQEEVTTLRFKKYGTHISLTAGIHAVDINGKNLPLLTPAEEKNGTFYVPLKKIATTLSFSVKKKGSVVSLTSPAENPLLTQEKEGDNTLFTNHYDGFTLSLPDEFTPDMTLPDILSRFESDEAVVEVYREVNKDLSTRLAYTAYTNRAVREAADLTVTHEGKEKYGKYKFQILAWNRPKLSRIEQDKNHYLKADFIDGNVVYTLLFKGTSPVDSLAEEVLSSFRMVPITCPDVEMPVFSGGKSPKDAETQDYFEETFGENASLTWGMYEPSYLHTWDLLPANEEAVDFHFPILLLYSEIYEEYRPEVVTRFLDTAWNEGRVLELTLQSPGNADPENFLYDVLDGKYDTFLEDYTQAVADFGHPVLFRPFNEANGDWCEYSAYQMSMDTELVRELVRYVGSFFDRAGADNVIWIFNPNGTSFPNFKWNDQRLYYPGDEYADIWGITAYNTGDYYEGETWQDFDTLYERLYADTLKMTDMPLMITEFASASKGGDKVEWVKDMHQKIGNYPEIKVAVWWSFADFDGETVSRAYYFLDSDALAPIWREYLDTLK